MNILLTGCCAYSCRRRLSRFCSSARPNDLWAWHIHRLCSTLLSFQNNNNNYYYYNHNNENRDENLVGESLQKYPCKKFCNILLIYEYFLTSFNKTLVGIFIIIIYIIYYKIYMMPSLFILIKILE